MYSWNYPEGFSFKDWICATSKYSYFEDPPQEPGVYLIVWKQIITNPEDGLTINIHILYIGSSQNLSHRFQHHEIFSKLKKKYDPLDFLFTTTLNFIEEEKKLIHKYHPKYNFHHNNNLPTNLPRQKVKQINRQHPKL